MLPVIDRGITERRIHMEKKRSTIRILSALLALVFVASSVVTVFAGGQDVTGGGSEYHSRPSPGSGTGGSPPPVPGWHQASNNCFKQAGRFFCIRAEYRVAYAEILFAVF